MHFLTENTLLQDFIFLLNLCSIFRTTFGATIEYINGEDVIQIKKGSGVKLEWRVAYRPLETVNIFYCGYKGLL